MKLVVALSILAAAVLLMNVRWLSRPVLYDHALAHHANHSRAMTRLAEAFASQDEFSILTLYGDQVHGTRAEPALPEPVRIEVHDRFYDLFRAANVNGLTRAKDGSAVLFLQSHAWWRENTDVSGYLVYKGADLSSVRCSTEVWTQEVGSCSTRLDLNWVVEMLWYPIDYDFEQKDAV